ncbi:MAG TPA: MAPEG family protein [Xanthobacteraceae bacterium]|nr:MAPEG family protein [Xanthobacteraceae bacterium]
MTVQAVLAPLFVLVALTFVMLVWMGSVRLSAVRRGEVRVKDIALGQLSWPPRVQQISNCYHNQFQLPVLFYVLTILALFLRKADLLFVIMAWVFVVLRIVHAAIHVTSNRVSRRFQAFAAGAVVLLLMWVVFAVRILLL